MIENYLYDTDIAGGYKKLEVKLVYENEHVEVFQLEQSQEHKLDLDNPINQMVPGTRCYRVGGRTDNLTVSRRPKYSDRVLQFAYPMTWFRSKNPQRPGEIYEMCDKGFASGHGELSEAITNQSLSVYQLRKSRPEFDSVFKLNEIKNTVQRISAPGAHIRVDQMPAAFDSFIKLLDTRIRNKLGNEMFSLSFAYLTHARVCDMLDIPCRVETDHRNLIPFVLADELNRKYLDLVDQLTSRLNINIFDLKMERTVLVKQLVSTWLKGTSFHKISHKILTDDAVIYNKLTAHEFSQVIIQTVDDAIKEIIKQYEEQ